MENEPKYDEIPSTCNNHLHRCGKDAIASGMAVEIDNKFVAAGIIIILIAGGGLSISGTIAGLSLIVIGAIIFLFKRLIEMMKRPTAAPKNRTENKKRLIPWLLRDGGS